MLDTLPPDVLEYIAYFASTQTFLGPPSGLLPLLALCRSTSATLRRSANPHLYARIFAAKFDLAAPRRRLARLCEPDTCSIISVNALADELVHRFTVLRRLRAELDVRSSNNESNGTAADELSAATETNTRLDDVLWTAFLMVLEDEGRNTAQLRNARVEAWLAVFWFDSQGASGAVRALAADRWPVAPSFSKDSKQKTRHALAMWLLWFFLDPAAYVANPDLYRRAERILRLVALNAPLYPLSHLPWTSFNQEPSQIHFGTPGVPTTAPFDPRAGAIPHSQQSAIEVPFTHFTRPLPRLTPLPPAAPANLALLALHACSRRNADTLDGGLELLELLGPSLAEAFIALPERTRDMNRERVQSSRGGQSEGDVDTFVNGWIESEEPDMRTDSYRWESEWLRCVYAVDENGLPFGDYGVQNSGIETKGAKLDDIMWKKDRRKYKTYQPGSIEGSWEGTFTYTEFHSFAALLAGASPSKLQDCLIAQHSQTWRLREYHLLSAPNSSTSLHSSSSCLSSALASTPNSSALAPKTTQKNPMRNNPRPLPVGDPILAHIPEGIEIEDDPSWLRMTLPSSYSPPPTSSSSNADPPPRVYNYTRYHGQSLNEFENASEQREGDEGQRETYASRVLDIVLRGEGHSGWGEFRLLGRVRPADGFITIIKEYTGGDRGRWLYRGYLVGGGSGIFEGEGEGERGEVTGGNKGYLVGRWRDTLTPAETHGYEGAFAMARRR